MISKIKRYAIFIRPYTTINRNAKNEYSESQNYKILFINSCMLLKKIGSTEYIKCNTEYKALHFFYTGILTIWNDVMNINRPSITNLEPDDEKHDEKKRIFYKVCCTLDSLIWNK